MHCISSKWLLLCFLNAQSNLVNIYKPCFTCTPIQACVAMKDKAMTLKDWITSIVKVDPSKCITGLV